MTYNYICIITTKMLDCEYSRSIIYSLSKAVKSNQMKKISLVLFIVSMVGVSFYTIIKGIDKAEAFECYQLQKQAELFPTFFLTDAQKSQCEAHNIIINLK